MAEPLIKISFVVPAFNIEKTVKRCVESIVSQGIVGSEIIIVDDCSNDSTAAIVQELSKQYKNIIYHKQEKNFGPGAARNKGIELAQGEYIEFVDGDDYLKEKTLCKALERIEKEKADMLIFGFESLGTKSQMHIGFGEGVYSKQEFNALLNDLFNNAILNSCCNKIYRKAALNYPFATSIFIGEDLVFNVGNYRNYNKICIIPEECYVYDCTHTSLTRSQYKMSLEKIDYMCGNCVEFFKECGMGDNDMAFLYYYYGVEVLNDFVFSKDYKKTFSRFKTIALKYEKVFRLAHNYSHCSNRIVGFVANNKLISAFLCLKNRAFFENCKALIKRILFGIRTHD